MTTPGDVPLALLAGGRATRLGAAARAIPKALVEVGGAPFIAHQLAWLRDQGLRRVVLCVGHLAEPIEAFVADGARFGLAVEYSRDGETLLGTAGALRRAAPRLGPLFWVMYGDSYLDVDLAPVMPALVGAEAAGVMTVFRNDDRFDRSNVLFRDGRILAYDKRRATAGMAHIDYGLALLRAEALGAGAADASADLGDVYRELVGQGRMLGYEVGRRFYEIGTPESLAETRRFFAARRASSTR